MDLLMIPFAVLCLWGIRLRWKGFFEDSLSRDSTLALRGILAVLVILHHLYMVADRGLFHLLISNVGSPCVMLFLFFSGYGLQKSFLKKPGYGTVVLKRRIPAIAVPYLLLIPVYWLLYVLLGTPWSVADTLFSLVSGSPIVRYGWYSECLVLLYLVYFLGTVLFRKKPEQMAWGMPVLTLVFAFALIVVGLPPFWYYSLPAFGFGILWAERERSWILFLRRHYWLWLVMSFAFFGVCFCGALLTFRTVFYWAASVGFLLFMVLVLQKVQFGNRALVFLGKLSFEIYSLHGFFMLLYRSELIYIHSDLLWGMAVAASAIPAAWLMKRCFPAAPRMKQGGSV